MKQWEHTHKCRWGCGKIIKGNGIYVHERVCQARKEPDRRDIERRLTRLRRAGAQHRAIVDALKLDGGR